MPIFVQRKQTHQPIGISAVHQVTDRVLDIHPQRSPEPLKQGDTPARPARIRLNLYFHPLAALPTEHRMGGMKVLIARRNQIVQGRLLNPQVDRANIRRGNPGTYGDQFLIG